MQQKRKLNCLIMALVAFLVIVAFVVGHRAGYIKGYTYVKDFKEEYEELFCYCREPEPLSEGLVLNLSILEKEKNKK